MFLLYILQVSEIVKVEVGERPILKWAKSIIKCAFTMVFLVKEGFE